MPEDISRHIVVEMSWLDFGHPWTDQLLQLKVTRYLPISRQ